MKIDLVFPSKSEFLPEFTIPINQTIFNEYKQLEKVVLEKEIHILENNKPYPEHDSIDWLTNRLYSYNLLDYSDEYPVLVEFKKFIYNSYVEYCKIMGAQVQRVYANCWANIIRNDGRTISPHTHSDAHINAPLEYSYVSGNICINAVDTKTYYANPFLPKQSYAIKNVPGELILFPSWALHWVDKNESSIPRISIAFDIVTEEVYNLPKALKNNFRKL
jgi:hypothetical protein